MYYSQHLLYLRGSKMFRLYKKDVPKLKPCVKGGVPFVVNLLCNHDHTMTAMNLKQKFKLNPLKFRSQTPVSPFPVPRSSFPVPDSLFSVPVLHSLFSIPRFPFLVHRSSLSVPRSPYSVPPFPFHVLPLHFPFLVPRFSFSVPRSSFP